MEDVVGPLVVDDVLGSRPLDVEDVQAVDMREFGGHAAEIVPDAGEDGIDLGRRLFRKRGVRDSPRPMRCSLSHGPAVRVMRAEKFAIALRSMRRMTLTSPTKMRPRTASAMAFIRRPILAERRRRLLLIRSTVADFKT